jgi:hypothetical protein
MRIGCPQDGKNTHINELIYSLAEGLVRLPQADQDIGEDVVRAEQLHGLLQGIHYLLLGQSRADLGEYIAIDRLQIVLPLICARIQKNPVDSRKGVDSDADGQTKWQQIAN